jgi:hypothetical protein
MPLRAPDQYELWSDLSLQNRHLRRNNWLHWGVHLLLVVLLVLMAYRPIVAIRVDSLGQPTLLDAVKPANEPGPEEAEYVSRLIAQYLLEVTSGSVQRDLTKAMRMATAEFAHAYETKVREDPTLTLLEKGNVRTELSFDASATEVKAQRDAQGRVTRYFVTLLATLAVHRADVNAAPLLTRLVTVRTTLLVVPRSKTALNGLLVDFFAKDFLDPAAKASPTISTAPLPTEPKQ